MSFPDPPPPPYGSDNAEGFWPPIQLNQEQSELNSQFDHAPPFKRQRNSENNPQNPAPFPPMNPRPNLSNVPGRGISHIFYKTRICAKFMEGNCRNGEHCTFAHGAEDMRDPPPNWQDLIREKDRGAGSWNDDQRRMKICKKFYNGEECPYGEKCTFLHERPPRFMNDIAKDQRESSAISLGTTNSITARICREYEITGKCPFGERCNFAHGQSGDSACANPLAVLPGKDKQEGKRLWKSTKKISGIYGDWIDEVNPPHLFSGNADL